MAMSGFGVSFRVQPEVLDQKAQEVSSEVERMERMFRAIQSTVSATQHYWIGEAGNAHRKAFQEQKDDIEMILKRLKEHPVDLRMIAGTYRETETRQTDAMYELSNNLID